MHSVVAPLTLAAVAGLALWRSMARTPLAAGIAGGVAAGLAVGIVLSWPSGERGLARRAASLLVRFVIVTAIALVGLIIVTADVGIVTASARR